MFPGHPWLNTPEDHAALRHIHVSSIWLLLGIFQHYHIHYIVKLTCVIALLTDEININFGM